MYSGVGRGPKERCLDTRGIIINPDGNTTEAVPRRDLHSCIDRVRTTCVHRGEHRTLKHHLINTFAPTSKQVESTQLRSQRKQKVFCASRRACMLKSVSGQLATQVPFWHYLCVLWGAPHLDSSFQMYLFQHF